MVNAHTHTYTCMKWIEKKILEKNNVSIACKKMKNNTSWYNVNMTFLGVTWRERKRGLLLSSFGSTKLQFINFFFRLYIRSLVIHEELNIILIIHAVAVSLSIEGGRVGEKKFYPRKKNTAACWPCMHACFHKRARMSINPFPPVFSDY